MSDDTAAGPAEVRLYNHINAELQAMDGIDDACVEWTGATTEEGYPVMNFRGQRIITPRRLVYAWKLHGFPALPYHGKKVIITTCKNKRCLNPNHLEEA